jgi:predicted aspartyl protease
MRYPFSMSIFKTNIEAVNPKQEQISTPPIEVIVDTGSELTWLPEEILKEAGIMPRRKRVFIMADGKRIEREIGYAILRVEEFETTDEVVFAREGDLLLLGVRTLEGFAVMVDNIGHKFVAQSTMAC